MSEESLSELEIRERQDQLLGRLLRLEHRTASFRPANDAAVDSLVHEVDVLLSDLETLNGLLKARLRRLLN